MKRQKSLKIVLLVLITLISILKTTTYAEDGFKIDGNVLVSYDINLTEKNITIPAGVTEIAPQAFCGNMTIESVVFPSTVKIIGTSAFDSCARLSSVTLNDGLERINAFAFMHNNSLTEIVIPGSVEHIESGAFAESLRLATVKVKSGVKGIGDGAFSGLPALSVIELPDTLESIDGDPFFESSSNFTIKAPQYNQNGEPTFVSGIAKELGSGVVYETTNYGVFITEPKNGSVEVDKMVISAEVAGSEVVTITATPNKRYEIDTVTCKTESGDNVSIDKITYRPENQNKVKIVDAQFTMPSETVIVTVTFKHKKHKITSSSGENGEIYPAGEKEVLEGNSQKYEFRPAEGYGVDTVKVTKGTTVETLEGIASYTFKNVEEACEIEVTFREVVYSEFKIGISNILQTTIIKPDSQNITVSTGESNNFISWTTTGIPSQNSRNFTFKMPMQNVSVIYNFNEPDYNTTPVQTTPSISGEKASATLELTNKVTSTKCDTVEIEVAKVADVTEVEIIIPTANIQDLVQNEDVQQLKISTPIGTLAIQKDALKTIKTAASESDDVAISIIECDKSDLTVPQQKIVGNSPVYRFEVTSDEEAISEFDGNIIVTVPYKLNGENPNGITVYYIDKAGNIQAMPTIYKNNTVSFTTTHFSEYYIKNILEEEQEPGDDVDPDNPSEGDGEDDIDPDNPSGGEDDIDPDNPSGGDGEDDIDPDNPSGGEDDVDPDNPSGGESGDDVDPDNPSGGESGDDIDPDNPSGGEDDVDPDNPSGGESGDDVDPDNPSGGEGEDNIYPDNPSGGDIEDDNNSDEPDEDEEKPKKIKKRKKKTEIIVEETVEQQEIQIEEKVEEESKEQEIQLNFTDLKENAWYIDAIKYAVKNNIASGTTKTTFSPDMPITRGQVITMLCRAYGIEEDAEGENFVDAGNTYYTDYILALKNRNIISGTGKNRVEPKREITRQELLVLIYKILEYTNNIEIINENGIEEVNFSDKEEIAIWAKNAIDYFINTKVIVGSNGKLNPKGKTTRAEAVQIIYNLANN